MIVVDDVVVDVGVAEFAVVFLTFLMGFGLK